MIRFFKYEACGNDFIVLDARKWSVNALSSMQRKEICHRKKGIGADGILMLEKSLKHAFKMSYYNADGNEVAMCGNGARVLGYFALHELEILFNAHSGYSFEAQNTLLYWTRDSICFQNMTRNKSIVIDDLLSSHIGSLYVEVGVPHVIYEFKKGDLPHRDFLVLGRKIAQDKRFERGVNVNFIEMIEDGHINMCTYERGVEYQTDSCGTGAVAAALYYRTHHPSTDSVVIHSRGGDLTISFDGDRICLAGSVRKVFQGVLSTDNLV